jgi:tRNA threonylcarbamoyladenosine modification (KEOPS) complex  Pcc1 subunit
LAKDDLCKCELTFEYRSPKEAELIAQAVKLDNPEFITLEIKGNTIHSTIKTSTINSMIHTLDDYLACLALAEKIVEKKNSRK